MDNEERERIFDFIIRQHERFAESLSHSDDRMTRLESGFVAVFKMISDTAKAQDRLEKSQRKWQRELKKSQQELRESHKQLQQELRKSHQELAASQKDTDERLKLFISNARLS
jgi:hypothetical protein